MDVERWQKMSDEALGRTILPVGISASTVLIELVIGSAIALLVYGQIAKRAGFSRWMSLGLLIPILGSLLPILFAIVPWPVERKLATPKKRRRKRS